MGADGREWLHATGVLGSIPLVDVGLLSIPAQLDWTVDGGRWEAELAAELARPVVPALHSSVSLAFTLDLSGVPQRLLQLLYGGPLPDPALDAAVDAWESEGGAL